MDVHHRNTHTHTYTQAHAHTHMHAHTHAYMLSAGTEQNVERMKDAPVFSLLLIDFKMIASQSTHSTLANGITFLF